MDGLSAKLFPSWGFPKRRRHTVQTSASSTSWTRTPLEMNCITTNNDRPVNRLSNLQAVETNNKQQDNLSSKRSRSKMGKLEPIRSHLRFTNVEPRHVRILPRLEMGDEYVLTNGNSGANSGSNSDEGGGWTIRKSPGMYSIQSSSKEFRGYHNIHLDDRGNTRNQSSFYEQTVAPLVHEFVSRQRNVCVLLHGAEGSGRKRLLLGEGNYNLSPSRSSSRRVSQTTEGDDDVSSLGCDGVSDVNHHHYQQQNEKHHRTPSSNTAPPSEVVFRNDVSVCCSRLGEVKSEKLDGAMLPSLEDEDGILPRMLAETFHRLKDRDPTLSTGLRDIPKLVPKNERTSKCCLRPPSECIIDDAAPNVSVEFYTGESESIFSSDREEGTVSCSLRISCIEIIDDLASGECTLNDLLDCYRTSPQDEIYVDFYESAYSNLDVSTTHPLLAENIQHNEETCMVYVEDVVEMQCRSYAAAMECIAMAEESASFKADSRREEDFLFNDKLYHTVYLLSLEHRNEQTNLITLSHQIILAKIDESMSDSASLALHSSYLSLSKMIDDIATFSGDTIRTNPLTKLLNEAIGGECCTVAIGTLNAEDGDGALPTLRLGEAMSWMYNTADRALTVHARREEETQDSLHADRSLNVESRGGGRAGHAQHVDRELNAGQRRERQTDHQHPRQIPSIDSENDINAFADTAIQLDGPKRLSQSSNVNSRRSSQSSHPQPRQIQPVDFQNDDAFAETTNHFDGPKRLSLSSNVNSRRSSQSSKVPRFSRNAEVIEQTEDNQELATATLSFRHNNSFQRIPTKTSMDEDSSRRAPSLGTNSYNSFSLQMDDIPEQARQSFASGALADSDNPFVRRYAAALDKSMTSIGASLDASTRQGRKSATSETSHSYDPLKDAKLYLSEIEAMHNQAEGNSVDYSNATTDAPQSDWRDVTNEIEETINKTRSRMMDRMKQQSRNSHLDYTLDVTPELPYQEPHEEKQFPPEYVSVEISSRESSERYQMAMDEIQNAHALALADMQRVLKALQAEKDELVREKNDNLYELQRAREDIGRLKAIYEAEGTHDTLSGRPEVSLDSAAVLASSTAPKPMENTPLQVFLRVRPLNKFEKHCRTGYSCIDANAESSVCIVKSPLDEEDTFEYNFDKVFGTDSSDQHIYSHVAEECLLKFMSGINCWVLVYGLKSSGKSYTLGTSPHSSGGSDQKSQGIIPRFTRSLFQEIRHFNEGNTFTVKCSVVGLYLEQMFDLLNPTTKHAPFLREGADGIQIEGATEAFCFEEAEVISLFQRGHAYRDSISANMNLDLRYFHTFFVMNLEHYNAALGQRKSSKMVFANLAGSLSPDSASKTTESRIFCRSLSIFQSLVNSLRNAESCVDYCASKLAWILKDAFVGSAFTKSLITASPSSLTFTDTLNAIKLGQKMRTISKPAILTMPNGSRDSEMNTDELKSKYMSAQSEVIVWRQRSDSLSRKTLELEKALNEEKQLVETLSVEKTALELNFAQDSEYVDTDIHNAFSLFNESFTNPKSRLDSYQDNAVETRSLRSSLRSCQRNYQDDAVETKSLRSSLRSGRRTSSLDNPRRTTIAAHMESMTTSAGAASLVASHIEDEEDEEPPPTETIIFDMSSQRSVDRDLSNVDAFYFLKEIEESYPRMNVLRGKQPVKYDNVMQQSQSCLIHQLEGKLI